MSYAESFEPMSPETSGGDARLRVVPAPESPPQLFLDPEAPTVIMSPTSAVDQSLVHRTIYDKWTDTGRKVGLLAEHACRAFAKQIGVDPDIAPPAVDLQDNYFHTARQLNGSAQQRLKEEIDEEIAPYERTSPISTARFIERVRPFANEPPLATTVVKLWLIEQADVDLPTMTEHNLTELSQKARHLAPPKRRW